MRLALLLLALGAGPALAAPAAVFVNEADVVRREPPPHDGMGMSTAYRISGAAPDRTLEFRKRVLDKGASIGLHEIGHDEVYYVLSGAGDVTSDGETRRLGPGGAAYLYAGASVGVAQVGEAPLALIIAYPVVRD